MNFAEILRMALVSLAERIIQMNAWLEKYQVELVL